MTNSSSNRSERGSPTNATIARSTFRIFVARLIGAGVGFLGITYFARALGASAMGTYFLFVTVLGLCSLVADLGLQGAVAKRLSEGAAPDRYLASAVALLAVPVALLVVAVLAFGEHVDQYVGAPVALVLAAAIVINEAAKLTANVLRGELRTGEIAELELGYQVAWLAVAAALHLAGFGVVALVYGYVAGIAVKFAWGAYKRSTPLGAPSLAHARSLVDYSKHDVIAYVDQYLYNWLDVAIIGLLLTAADVGAYEMAWRLAAVVMLLSGAIRTTIMPRVSAWDAAGSTDEIEALVPAVLAASLFLVVPAFFGTALFARELLTLLFGPEYAVAWLVLIVLMAGKLIEAVDTMLKPLLSGVDRPDLKARAVVVGSVLNVTLNVALVIPFGILGAAVATTVSFAVSTGLAAYYLSGLVTLRFPYRAVGWCLLAAAGMALALATVQTVVTVDSLVELVGVVFFGGAVYGLLALGFPPFRLRFVRGVASVLA